MIWPDEISFDGYEQKKQEWFSNNKYSIGAPPISAQYALDLLFKTLMDDKYDYPYLTTIPETTEQTNSIMLDAILYAYSRDYRRYQKRLNKQRRNKNDSER